MIDIKALEKNESVFSSEKGYADYYRQNLIDRSDDPKIVEDLLALNKKRKSLTQEMESSKALQNKAGQEIAKLKKEKADASAQLEEMQKLSSQVKDMAKALSEVEVELEEALLRVPNLLAPEVHTGKSEEDNKVIREWGEVKSFSFEAKEHWELGENLEIIDFDRAAKVTGSRFAFLKGAAAQLERALIQFKMDIHANEHGYEEMIPPFIVNDQSLQGTGQFPKFKEDVFNLSETNYYLIPTAEVPVTNYYAGEMLTEKDLPKKFVAYSPCFRSEAGSYGRDTKGLIRQHQFNKVELVKFTHPDKSDEEHEQLTLNAEKILQMLELPYRTSLLCSGDISFGARKCFDLEVWLPGQKAYREISSCSNFGDFQARRANIRFRPTEKGKPQFVHTLNGSGLAVGRTLVAILENYQNEDGSITIPDVLRNYMGGKAKISL